ncbi:aspartic peptidase domain-containing protein [Elsinoe ampelina]|uniref:Aspartic peptidase domain-containing protein n=1 Tax=Elsinoe ampelina TaxID=302913 RepID=A0A6A6GPC9_9PEZI|nr:aspartic peptidase domain-containing protein [Elsinoe ampelina]
MAATRPLSLTPAAVWDYEAEWNLFEVSVGTPPQTFRLLPHVNGNTALVPTGDICRSIESKSTCAARHGVLPFQGRNSTGFLANESSTWESIQVQDAGLVGYDGVKVDATFGFDTVSFGPDQVLDRRVTGAFEDLELWTGTLGLDARSVNVSRLGSPQRSLMSALRSNGSIPSLSYGYVAGAYYRYESVPASLTLGGVDTSRYIPSPLSIPFSNSTTSPLEVSLTSISLSSTTNGTVSLSTAPLTLTIDSSIPELILPQSLCDILATTFRLTYDNETLLYERSSSYDTTLTRASTSLSFTFTSPSTSSSSSPAAAQEQTITLPYTAFRLSHPLASSFSGYFPIRAASNPPYTLGRVILQEAYLTVDHERRNFSLSQAVYTNPMPPVSLRAIEPSSGASGTAGTGSSSSASSEASPSKGAIAGIATGAVLGLLLLLFVAGWYILRRRRRRRPHRPRPPPTSNGPVDRDEKRLSSDATPELAARDRPGEVGGETAKWGSFGVQELRAREAAGAGGRTSEMFSPLSGRGEGSERMFPGGGSSPVSPLVERRSEVL